MDFNFNVKGISRLISWGLPIAGLIIGGPIGCIVGLLVASCVTVKTKED